MNKLKKSSPKVRERAIRLVLEYRGEYRALLAASASIAPKIGCVPQTLLDRVRPHEGNTGDRDGVTTAETQRVKECEVKELRRANEMLKLASAAFAGAEPYRPLKP